MNWTSVKNSTEIFVQTLIKYLLNRKLRDSRNHCGSSSSCFHNLNTNFSSIPSNKWRVPHPGKSTGPLNVVSLILPNSKILVAPQGRKFMPKETVTHRNSVGFRAVIHKCVMFDKLGSGSGSILFSIYGRSYKYPLFTTKSPYHTPFMWTPPSTIYSLYASLVNSFKTHNTLENKLVFTSHRKCT